VRGGAEHNVRRGVPEDSLGVRRGVPEDSPGVRRGVPEDRPGAPIQGAAGAHKGLRQAGVRAASHIFQVSALSPLHFAVDPRQSLARTFLPCQNLGTPSLTHMGTDTL